MAVEDWVLREEFMAMMRMFLSAEKVKNVEAVENGQMQIMKTSPN